MLRLLLRMHKEGQRDFAAVAQTIRDSALFERMLEADEQLSWAKFYELPLNIHLFFLLVVTGAADVFASPFSDVDDLKRRLEAFMSWADDEGPIEERIAAFGISDLSLVIELQMSMVFNLRSYFTYSVPLNYCVQRVRDGSDLAFRRAVTIDPTVIQAPTMAHRLAFAILEDDKGFLTHFRRAVFKGPTAKRAPYGVLRIADLVLKELSTFATLSREEIHDVIVNDLRLYGGKDGDSFKGLFALLDAWAKDSTI